MKILLFDMAKKKTNIQNFILIKMHCALIFDVSHITCTTSNQQKKMVFLTKPFFTHAHSTNLNFFHTNSFFISKFYAHPCTTTQNEI